MNQLRAPDLFRYKQNYLNHKQKVMKIMNRSSQSIKYLSQSQTKIIKTTKQSHKKAFAFQINQRYRTISSHNESFVNRMLQNNNKSKTNLSTKQNNRSFSQVMRVRQNLMRTSLQSATSRVNTLSKANDKIANKLVLVKSTISSQTLTKDFKKHLQRSSTLSKFKIDTSNFKFIPKNQLVLSKLSKLQPLYLSRKQSSKSNRQTCGEQNLPKGKTLLTSRVSVHKPSNKSSQIFNPQKVISISKQKLNKF